MIPKEPEGKIVITDRGIKNIQQGSPWVWETEIKKEEKHLPPGALVWLSDRKGRFVGIGYYNPNSKIRIRMLTKERKKIDVDFLVQRIKNAHKLRRSLFNSCTNAYRIVFAEADYLPGIIIDKYDKFIVVQFHTAGAERMKEEVVKAINILFSPLGIYERNDIEVRKNEGLEERKGVLDGNPPPDVVMILENGIRFLVDIKEGQKTGFYIDQRENRKSIERYAEGRVVLDLFSYTGGFAMYALRGKAKHVISVDTSEKALHLAVENAKINGFNNYTTVREDAFSFLEQHEEAELIILDPPGFVKRVKDIEKGSKKYIALNSMAISRIRDGFLFTSSCSGGLTMEDFKNIIRKSFQRTQKKVSILETRENPPDHPVNPAHPWSAYLKSMLLYVSG